MKYKRTENNIRHTSSSRQVSSSVVFTKDADILAKGENCEAVLLGFYFIDV